MSVAMIVSFTGVLVAGLAGVLGVWMERDSKSHLAWALLFSALILATTGVEMVLSMYQTYTDGQTDEQMALLLERLGDLSEDNPELGQFVAAELAVQARANPAVVSRMEANVKAKGGDPSAVRKRAEEGRRQAAGMGKAGGPRTKARADRPSQQRPREERPTAPERVEAASAAVADIEGAGDAEAAVKAAQAQARRVLADANKEAEAITAQADEMKAQAEALQAQADKTLATANKAKAQADAALKQAQSAAAAATDVKGKAGKAAKTVKVPGL
jgi:hypothetical protein